MGDSGGPRRRMVVPYIEQVTWRRELFAHIRVTGTYQNAVAATLRPLWGVGAKPGKHGRWWHRVFDFTQLARRLDRSPDEDGARYVDSVLAFVANTLRITRDGEPTRWACQLVHNDITVRDWNAPIETPGANPFDDLRDNPKLQHVQVTLRVAVSPYGAFIETQQGESGDKTAVRPGVPKRFDDWAELRREAIERLESALGAIETEYRTLYPDQRNTSRDERFADDFATLAAYLIGRRGIPEEVRKRLLKRAADIEIDLP